METTPKWFKRLNELKSPKAKIKFLQSILIAKDFKKWRLEEEIKKLNKEIEIIQRELNRLDKKED